MLAVIETHPVQYHAPVYRRLQQHHGVPVTTIYGSDFSVAGYRDHDFRSTFAWRTDLLSGYSSEFLSRSTSTNTSDRDGVSTRGMARALKRATPSAVMVLGYSPRFHRVAWYQAWRLGRPILFRGETTDVAKDRPTPKAALRDLALRGAYSRCQALLYIGQHSRAHFVNHGVDDARLFFSPYCVDETTFEADEAARNRQRPSARRELGLTEHDWAILYVGKLSRIKGIDFLLSALEGVRAPNRGRVTLICVGDGELRESVERAGEAGRVSTRVVGFRNQGELSRYYHAADLMVLASRSETWGLVVNEALIHGVPCVVSHRVGSGTDLVEPDRTGSVFVSESAGAFREAMVRAMPLARRADIRDVCRAKVGAYSVDQAARGIAEAYRHVTATT